MTDLIRDENGKWSSTRISLLVGVSVFIAAFVGETFFGTSVSDVYPETWKLLIGAGIAATGVRSALKNRNGTA